MDNHKLYTSKFINFTYYAQQVESTLKSIFVCHLEKETDLTLIGLKMDHLYILPSIQFLNITVLKQKGKFMQRFSII